MTRNRGFHGPSGTDARILRAGAGFDAVARAPDNRGSRFAGTGAQPEREVSARRPR